MRTLLVTLVAASLFVGACFLPALRHPGWDTHTGWECLTARGWWFAYPWWANPLALIAWVLLICRVHTGAAVFATLAAGLALTTHVWTVQTADEVMVGYFLWQASFVALAAGCWWLRPSRRL